METNQQHQERRRRLQEWFKISNDVWSDIEAEHQYSLNDGLAEAIGKTCENRDYMSGYCGGLQQAIDLKQRAMLWDLPKPI